MGEERLCGHKDVMLIMEKVIDLQIRKLWQQKA